MNTRAILFILGLVIGAIAVWVWKKGEIENPKPCQAELERCAEQLREARGLLASTASVVVVGPTANRLSAEPLVIHVDKQPVVYWKSLNPGHHLGIKFEATDYPAPAKGEPPFIGGANGQSQAIQCNVDTCFSYGLNPNVAALFNAAYSLPCGQNVPAPPPGQPAYTQCLEYKYWQTLDTETVDGHIIIVKP